jgi:leader peptidase (prepilin peptidase)/N-methyltransferase
MPAVVYVVCGLFGLVIGSFLNVVIYRLPRRESLAHPPSHCPVCGAPVRPWDNVPVFSWFALRGRCRDCSAPISARYPLVEALTAALFVGAAWRLGARAELADFCVFFAFLVALSGIDLDHHILPSRIIYPAAGASLVLLALASGVDHNWHRYQDAVIGGALALAALFVIHVAVPRGMGFGDVRLAGLLGLNLGWLGLAHVAVGLFAGFLFGAVVGVGLMAVGAASRKSRIPFGPFLAAGAVVGVLWGTTVVNWWLGPR